MGNEKRKVKLNTGLAPVQEPPLQTPAAAFPSDSGQFPNESLPIPRTENSSYVPCILILRTCVLPYSVIQT